MHVELRWNGIAVMPHSLGERERGGAKYSTGEKKERKMGREKKKVKLDRKVMLCTNSQINTCFRACVLDKPTQDKGQLETNL